MSALQPQLPPPALHSADPSPRSPTHFMHFPVMGLDGAEGSGAEAAVLKITPVGWLLAVGIQVLPEVDQILAAARRGQEGGRAWGL